MNLFFDENENETKHNQSKKHSTQRRQECAEKTSLSCLPAAGAGTVWFFRSRLLLLCLCLCALLGAFLCACEMMLYAPGRSNANSEFFVDFIDVAPNPLDNSVDEK